MCVIVLVYTIQSIPSILRYVVTRTCIIWVYLLLKIPLIPPSQFAGEWTKQARHYHA